MHFLHQKAAVFESWPVKGEEYQGHSYKATFQFSSPQPVKKITIRYLNPMGSIEIKKILLDQEDLKNLVKRKFELGVPFIFKNASAFPRVFTIGRAMVLTSEKEILKKLRELDPREYVLLDRLPSGYRNPAASFFSTEEAKIVHYSPRQIKIASKTAEDKFLILSDTYSPYWKATIDKKSSTILRADYGLRGLYVPKGNHQIEFSFHYYPFYYGLIITCISLGLLLFWSVTHYIKHR